MNTERLDTLLNLYVDEALDERTKAELEQLLLAWPQARERFWQQAGLNANLRQYGQESWGQRRCLDMVRQGDLGSSPPSLPGGALSATDLPRQTAAPRPHRGLFWMAATGAVIAGAYLLALSLLGDRYSWHIPLFSASASNRISQTPLPGPAPLDQYVAVLRKAIDVHWKDAAHAPQAGQPLVARRLEFDQGLVEIQTTRGAVLRLEGPAQLEIINDMHVACQQGKLRVDVPPAAQGFQLTTPLVQVIDRGTSFAMQVGEGQPAEVHVFAGMVELLTAKLASPHELHQGKAVRIDSPGSLYDIPTRLEAFPSAAQAEERTRIASAGEMKAWFAQGQSIQQDPSCLVYFDFQEADPHDMLLPNRSQRDFPGSHGTIIGCRWVRGRWPGKRALDFKSISDRVRFEIPGKHAALTCIASVRLDALDHTFNALLMSGDAVVGELQWQISMPAEETAGQMRVGRRSRPGWGFVEDYRSPPTFRREQFGNWLHLAVVWDAQRGTYHQFVNGEPIATGPTLPADSASVSFLRTGDLELGNWTPKGGQPSQPVRNFNGRIDEFAMFSRVFSPQEIKDLYELNWRLDASEAGVQSEFPVIGVLHSARSTHH